MSELAERTWRSASAQAFIGGKEAMKIVEWTAWRKSETKVEDKGEPERSSCRD